MGRFERVAKFFTLTAVLFLSSGQSTVIAERSEAFLQRLQWYHDHYPFMGMDDTVYTFEGECRFPEGYRRLDSAQLTHFSNWISDFPVWHRWKPVGQWGGMKKFEYDQISRAVHLPWAGSSFTEMAIPMRILGEYLIYTGNDRKFDFWPAKGNMASYGDWLSGKPVYNARGELMFKPAEPRQADTTEYYAFLNFCMQNLNYAGLIRNCIPIDSAEAAPGDMYVASDSLGRKGRVLIILRMMVNDAGNKLYVIATGCPRACDFHIPLVNEDRDYPWLTVEQVVALAPADIKGQFYRLSVISKLFDEQVGTESP